MPAPKTPTPDRILDAAEALFAQHGYDGVTTRAITGLAGVRLNLLSYHFGSKEKLFKAVIDRRLDIIIKQREQALSRLRDSGSPMTVGGILEAFIHPYYALSQGDRGWLNHARVVALSSQSEHGYPVLDQYMQRTVRVFMEALQEALPDIPADTIRTGFYYAISLMMGAFSGINRIDELVDGAGPGQDLRKAYLPLVTFAEGGLMALAAAERRNQSKDST